MGSDEVLESQSAFSFLYFFQTVGHFVVLDHLYNTHPNCSNGISVLLRLLHGI